MSQQYKVLVVDDDLKLRSLLERYLTEQGFCSARCRQRDRPIAC